MGGLSPSAGYHRRSPSASSLTRPCPLALALALAFSVSAHTSSPKIQRQCGRLCRQAGMLVSWRNIPLPSLPPARPPAHAPASAVLYPSAQPPWTCLLDTDWCLQSDGWLLWVVATGGCHGWLLWVDAAFWMLIGACNLMDGCCGWLLRMVVMGGCYGWMLVGC